MAIIYLDYSDRCNIPQFIAVESLYPRCLPLSLLPHKHRAMLNPPLAL